MCQFAAASRVCAILSIVCMTHNVYAMESVSKAVQAYSDGDVDAVRSIAQQGDAEAQGLLARCYFVGEGLSQDQEQAVEWWRKAAEQGAAKAQVMLGVCYACGVGVQKDSKQAAQWLYKAAVQGDSVAQNRLGRMYLIDEWMPKNAKEVLQWLQNNASQGDAEAQGLLGEYFYWGTRVPKDIKKAAEWLCKAAEQGNARAQSMLGTCYALGNGIAKDNRQAIKWLRAAAEQGYAEAQGPLGLAYEQGDGVPKDLVRAYMWYNLSAAQDNETSAKHRDNCEHQMTPTQIAEAQRLTVEFVPKKQEVSTSNSRSKPQPIFGANRPLKKNVTLTSGAVPLDLKNRVLIGTPQQPDVVLPDYSIAANPVDSAVRYLARKVQGPIAAATDSGTTNSPTVESGKATITRTNPLLILLSLYYLCALPAIFLAFAYDQKLRKRRPNVKAYGWGYFTGFQLVLVPLVVMAGCIYENAHTDRGLFLKLLGFSSFFSIFGIFILCRRVRWMWIIYTVLSMNPLVWFINAIYIKNRWEELGVEQAETQSLKTDLSGKGTASADKSSGNNVFTVPVKASVSLEKTCPMCAEHIRLDAVLCRFCGTQFSEHEVREVSENVRRTIEEEARQRDVRKRIEVEKKYIEAETLREEKARESRYALGGLIVMMCALVLLIVLSTML